MKQLTTLLLLLFFTSSLWAQLPNGSTAPDWTLTDLNGVQVNLYDELDNGKSVVIDFSATWCPPCWNYHNTGILDDLNEAFGPEGTDEIRVYYIESDPSTSTPCLYGDPDCVGGTLGNWVDGTSYQIFDPPNASIPASYQIGYYPTFMAICPNKKLYEVGQASYSTWESWLLETCALDEDFLKTDETCFGDGTSMIDLTVTGGVGNLNFSWSNGANTEDLIGVPQGTYYCTITEGRGHSVETGPIVISGPETPVEVQSETISDVQCNGNNNGFISIIGNSGAGGISYAWSNGSNSSTITDLEPGFYDVVVTDANGCTVQEFYEIYEPEVLALSSNTVEENCDQSNGYVILNGFGGTEPYSYTLNGQTSSSGLFNNLEAGTYTVDVVDANGCNDVQIVEVEEDLGPVAVASTSQILSCSNTEIYLDGFGSTTGPSISYLWTTEDGNILEGETSLNPIVDAAGTYTILVSNATTGCEEFATIVIDGDFEFPIADAGNDKSLDCLNTTTVLNGNGSDSGSNIVYIWTTENGNIVSGQNTNQIEVNAAGIYVLEVLNELTGCSSISTAIVTQSADVPTADAGSVQAITCATNIVVLDGSGSEIGSDITYVWTTEDGNIVEGVDSTTPSVDQAGTYLLEVINTSNGCSSFSSVEVVLDQNEPFVTAENINELTCVILEQTISIVVDVQTSSVVWSTMDGHIVSGDDTNQVVVDAPGVYMVTVTSALNGCSASYNFEMLATIDDPVSQFTFNQSEFTFNFNSESTGNNASYFWDFGDGSTSNEENPVHLYSENGAYDVCLTVENECGTDLTCTTINVSLGASLVHSNEVSHVVCNGACDGEYNIVPQDEISNYTVILTGPNGFVSDAFTGNLCAGLYMYVLTNEVGDTVEDQFEITEPSAIAIESWILDYVSCYGANDGAIELNLTGGTGELQVTWDNGLEGTMISDLEAGTYVATILDENDCPLTLEFEITEPDQIKLVEKVIEHVTETSLGTIDITVEGGTPNYQFLWSNGDTTEDVTELDPGEYKVIITDENGCKVELGPFNVLDKTTSILEIEMLQSFTIHPNPVYDQAMVHLVFDENVKLSLTITDKLGRQLSTTQLEGQEINHTIQVSDLISGLYFVQLTHNGQTSVKKFIVQ